MREVNALTGAASCTIIRGYPPTFEEASIMAQIDLSGITPASIVDARGSACPGPLLEAKKAIGSVKVNEVLEVLSSDPGTKEDIPAWAGKVGHEYLGRLPADGYDRLFVRRKK
jgi:tRNA 2-thiouridine synthesizing protein A